MDCCFGFIILTQTAEMVLVTMLSILMAFNNELTYTQTPPPPDCYNDGL